MRASQGEPVAPGPEIRIGQRKTHGMEKTTEEEPANADVRPAGESGRLPAMNCPTNPATELQAVARETLDQMTNAPKAE